VQAYFAELAEQGMSSWTVWGRLAGLLCTIEAMAPTLDFKWLRRIVRHYERQTVNKRNKLQRLQPTHILLDWAIRQMDAARLNPVHPVADLQYRNALIIGLLSCCPVRLTNLTAIEIDHHLVRQSTGYALRFSRDETKTGHPFAAPLSPELAAPLDHYISVVRPRLLKGQSHARLWVSERGTPMASRTIHEAVTLTTQAAFGRSINAHLFRDCAATFVALEDPEHIGVVSPLLGHIDPRAAEQHYIQANQIAAGRRLRSSVAELRKSLSRTKDRNSA
jgi:site-specific recombinase XerD